MKLLILFLLSSCITAPMQKLNPETYYKNDICITDLDTEYQQCGTGVFPYKPVYNFQVDSYGKLNYFVITTCHEEDTTENPDKGIFKKNGRIKIAYIPTLEEELYCVMYVSVYNKNQKHAWGLFAFQHPHFKLPATLKCNGIMNQANGVSVCQSREGLWQDITFNEEVHQVKPVIGGADRKTDCPELKSEDNKRWLYQLPERECIYQFIGKESRKVHRLYSVGYEDIAVRE